MQANNINAINEFFSTISRRTVTVCDFWFEMEKIGFSYYIMLLSIHKKITGI